MDQKSWLWKKRSTEKTLVADKANNSHEEEVSEIQKLQIEKTELERDLRISNEKLSFALSECNAKDNIAKKQVKIAEEAIAGWEKAETEAISLKQELDKVLQQKATSEERIGHLDAALKECMQQLRFVRDEQEERVRVAVLKSSEEFEKIRITLDEKLAEAGKRLAKLDAENTQLSKALAGKDKVIEDITKYRTQIEADFNALMLRVETTEKENASLKYEVRVLEKELDIRNEEIEFNRRTADLAQKQHQQSVKRIANLEMECQKLRLLVQKRLPGPASLTKMKNEVEMLGKDQFETRRRKSSPSSSKSVEFCVEVASDAPSNRIDLLTQQLYTMEEENKTLKSALNKTSSELKFPSGIFTHRASRLSQAEGQAEDSPKGQKAVEPGIHSCVLQENSLAASSDVGSDDRASCAESWASALLSELEHFKNEKQFGTSSYQNMRTSEMNLMDDFAEMEKLAVVSAECPAVNIDHSFDEGKEIIHTSGQPSCEHSSPAQCMDSAPVYDCSLEPLISSQKTSSESIAAGKVPGWLSDMLKMLLEQCRVSQRNPHEVLEHMKVVLAQSSADSAVFCGNENTDLPDVSYNSSGPVIQTSPNKSMNLDAFETSYGDNILNIKKSDQKFRSDASISIHKILELLEGINIQSQDNGVAETFSGKDNKLLSHKNSENPTGYMARVFQWKTDELSSTLQQLVSTCNDLLNGKADLEQFAQQIASNLEWIMNHCFSLQDVSSMKYAIRNQFDWDEAISDGEVDAGLTNHPADCDNLPIQREDLPYLPRFSPLTGHNSSCHMEPLQPLIKEESKMWNGEQENQKSSIENLECRLQSEIVMGDCFRIQLQESKDIIENLHSEMETMKQSKGKSGSQIEKQKMMKEDLETKLMEINREWGKACLKISHLENELENKSNSCERLEETCKELRTQLESMTNKGVPDKAKHWEKQLHNDWEITAASEKLAECQETILNLGKQLKALASPNDAALFDKVISTPAESAITSLSTPQKTSSQRSSLLDKMLAEDNDRIGSSSRTKQDTQNGVCDSGSTNAAVESWGKFANPNEIIHEENSKSTVESMDIVPRKKNRGRSFFRKLFWRRKKGNSHKTLSS